MQLNGFTPRTRYTHNYNPKSQWFNGLIKRNAELLKVFFFIANEF